MFMICNYDFCRDINCLVPSPVSHNRFTKTTLSNGIFNHWNATRNVSTNPSTNPPTTWDYLTLMNANFDNNIQAGNITYTLSNIDGFRVKRRKTDEQEYTTIAYVPTSSLETGPYGFTVKDNLNQNGVTYEYAIVPVTATAEGVITESQVISNEIESKFEGVFICDADTIYKFYAGVEYGAETQVQKVGTFEPFGKKYPVVVSNGVINYAKGSVKGTVLPQGFLDNRNFNRLEMVKERKSLLEFLTNKRAKILKDWNGNFWLCCIIDTPTTDYIANTGMGLANVSANWIEIGDSNSASDLRTNGLIKAEG